MDQRPNHVLRWTVVITTISMIVGNVLATTLPLFGRTTAEVSDRYQVLVTPAGYVFSIWGLIYLAMLAYCSAQFVEPLASHPLPDRLALPLIVSNVANVMWLVLWHGLLIYLTVVVMLVLLASLATAYVIAHRQGSAQPSILERWALRAPLGLYLGWISVATIANISAALSAIGWLGGPLSPEWWALIVLSVGAAIALVALVREGDTIFAAVFVWAFAGIALGQTARLVVLTAVTLAVVLELGIIASAVQRRRLV